MRTTANANSKTASRKKAPPPPAPKGKRKAPPAAPKPAPKPRKRPPAAPAKPASKAPQPAPAAPAAVVHPTPAAKPPLVLDDPFDTTPTPDIPGVYMGVYKNVQRRVALAYRRDEDHVWTIMFSDLGGERVCVKWRAGEFDANMRHAPVPLCFVNMGYKRYPLKHALAQLLRPDIICEPAAYRVLFKLSKGQDPGVEDSIDDLLDMTPSINKPRAGSVTRQRTISQKMERSRKRKQRLASLTPAAKRAWQDKRNARRKLRRMNMKKARQAK